MPAPRIVATAGHIDHGKSTLVEALTGTNPDRLPEEQKRGMTIELGFAHLDLPDPAAEGGGWHIGIVDVPGHADFVRNMVAGVGSIDAAMLVIAVDDGWMPQTEEHFRILLHLGVTHGLVALTKSDLATSLEQSIAEVRARLAGTPWAEAPVVPVCAIDGSGLDELKAALAALLRDTRPPADIGKPRLFVDRVFSPRGAGTVVTGTLTGGCFKTGDEVVVQPAGLRGKIRGLQNHNRTVERARPGMRTAIQIGGVAMAHDGEGEGIWRGDVIESASAPSDNTSVMHIWLSRDHRPEADPDTSPPPVKHGQKVWFHHGSSGNEARLYLSEGRTLEPGGAVLAELRLRSPAAVFAGDRFILRDFSRRHTLGGGIVLEPAARARAWKNERYRESMRLRSANPADAAAWLGDRIGRDGFAKTGGLLERSRFSKEEIDEALRSLPNAVARGEWIIDAARWRADLDAAADAVREHHRLRPHEPGMPLAALRTLLQKRLPDPALTDVALEDLGASGFVRTKDIIRAAAFKVELAPEVRRACLTLRGVLFADKKNPPGISTYIKTPEEKAALRAMVQSGEVFMLDPDIAMLPEAYDELKARIVATLRSAGRATMAALRDATGTTRRILVPLCERMDRERVTVRDGDFRRLAHGV